MPLVSVSLTKYYILSDSLKYNNQFIDLHSFYCCKCSTEKKRRYPLPHPMSPGTGCACFSTLLKVKQTLFASLLNIRNLVCEYVSPTGFQTSTCRNYKHSRIFASLCSSKFDCIQYEDLLCIRHGNNLAYFCLTYFCFRVLVPIHMNHELLKFTFVKVDVPSGIP